MVVNANSPRAPTNAASAATHASSARRHRRDAIRPSGNSSITTGSSDRAGPHSVVASHAATEPNGRPGWPARYTSSAYNPVSASTLASSATASMIHPTGLAGNRRTIRKPMATNTSAATEAPPGNPNTRGCTEATRRNNGMYAIDSSRTTAPMTVAARVAGPADRTPAASAALVVPVSPIDGILRRRRPT